MLPICGKNFLTFSINYFQPDLPVWPEIGNFPCKRQSYFSHFSPDFYKNFANDKHFFTWVIWQHFLFWKFMWFILKMYSVTVRESEFFLIIGIWSLYKFLRWFKKLLPLNFLSKWIFDVCNLMAQILVRCNWIVLSTKGFPALETFEFNHSIFVQFGPKTKSLTSFWFWRIKQNPT